jgi:G3E family GTPase
MTAAAPEAIPVVVIGGYLGAGKTTLINHLLRHAGGRRIAVLVNDFGEINVDADLIEGAEGGVLSLAGGCVCCAFGADLMGALDSLRDLDPRPDIVLIETSGVGLPGAVARSVGLASGLVAIGVAVVADAETLRARAADRYVGDTVLTQLRDADLLLLSKTDLAGEAETAAVRVWLAGVAPRAAVVTTDHGRAPPDLVLGPREAPPAALAAGQGEAATHAHFRTGVRRFAGPVDVAALAADLTAAGSDIVRAKGAVTDLDGRRKLLQVVGRRAAITARTDDRHTEDLIVWIAADPHAH